MTPTVVITSGRFNELKTLFIICDVFLIAFKQTSFDNESKYPVIKAQREKERGQAKNAHERLLNSSIWHSNMQTKENKETVVQRILQRSV